MPRKKRFICLAVTAPFMLAFLVFACASDLKSNRNNGSADPANAARGKAVFENKCSDCHTIGGGRKTGPDLKGVTQKSPHKWLVEFITNPEKMFNAKNPAAEKLLKEYAGFKMPVLGLSKEQVEDVLAYIKEQSQ